MDAVAAQQTESLQFWPAVFAGLIGAAVMSALGWIMKPLGVRLDLHMMWGTMLKLHGPAGYAVGLLVHAVVSTAIALIYALFFAVVNAGTNLWAWGLLAGLIHWVIAGAAVMPLIPALHPGISERAPRPGFFVRDFGSLDVGGFLISHLCYGLVVGVSYGSLG